MSWHVLVFILTACGGWVAGISIGGIGRFASWLEDHG